MEISNDSKIRSKRGRLMEQDERPNPHKMYVIVRGDLPRGLRAAQAGHAIADVCLSYTWVANRWRDADNFLIVLQVPNEKYLRRWSNNLRADGVVGVTFFEPDLNGEMTALAALPRPDQNSLFKNLPLAYSFKAWWQATAEMMEW